MAKDRTQSAEMEKLFLVARVAQTHVRKQKVIQYIKTPGLVQQKLDETRNVLLKHSAADFVLAHEAAKPASEGALRHAVDLHRQEREDSDRA